MAGKSLLLRLFRYFLSSFFFCEIERNSLKMKRFNFFLLLLQSTN